MFSKFSIINLLLLINVVKAFLPSDWNIELETQRPAFNPALYEDALDSEKCKEQLNYLRQNTLGLQFLDAGIKLPRGITQFNFIDFGNFDQCIGIEQDVGSSVIEGKYCRIQGPLSNNFNKLAEAMNWQEFDENILNRVNIDKIKLIQSFQRRVKEISNGIEIKRSTPESPVIPTFSLAVCVPKTCTTSEAINSLLFNLTSIGFHYEDVFCRFKDDKPWVPADYIATIIFLLIGLLTIISTYYDIWHVFVLKTDPKSINALYRSFSVYTNTKSLMKFSSSPSSLNCVDGIRAISMFWIIVGHTYLMLPPSINTIDTYEWMLSEKSTWIFAAPFAVDTFFFLGGMLLVYTTVGKLSERNLLNNLHLFYTNRLVRMFPLLATIVLLQASLLHRMGDGPRWYDISVNVDNCRTYWWSTLLHIQNLVNVKNQCIAHAWYLAIDIHCYIVSPIVLYWLLGGKKKQAWTALTCSILISFTAATTYSFANKFQPWNRAKVREGGNPDYQYNYYFFTVTRAPPFFVGMVFGYILNIWKGQSPRISRVISSLLWILSGGTMLTLTYITHLVTDPEYESGILDDLVNSFARSLWVVSVGWIIFACQYGYGGPVDWFLSLDIWKLPSRISYAIYLFHFKFQFLLYGSYRVAAVFSDFFAMYEFFAQVTISYVVAFILTVVIDSPFSALLRKLLGEGPKRAPVQKDMADKDKTKTSLQ